MKKLFVTKYHRGGGQPYCLTKNYPHFQKQPGLLKIFFSSALAFVLSMFCFPNISNLFSTASAPSTISDVGEAATTSNITWKSETLNGNTYYYTELGTYPQTYYSGSTASMSKTGKTYTVGSTIWTEYSLSGQKYVSGKQTKFNSNYTFKDGTMVGSDGTERWFKVEPIKWWIIDGTNPNSLTSSKEIKVISDVALASNVPFNKTHVGTNASWSSSNVRTWLNGTFLTDSGLSSYKDSVIKNETVKNNTYSNISDGSGTNTSDYAYLLSYDERNKYSVNADPSGLYYLRSHRATGVDKGSADVSDDDITQQSSMMASPSDFTLSNHGMLLNCISDYRNGVTNCMSRSLITKEIEISGTGATLYGCCFMGPIEVGYVDDTASSISIRPCLTLNYKVTITEPEQTSVTWYSEKVNGHELHYTYFGEYPQTYASGISTAAMAATGKVYTFGDNIWTEYSNSKGEKYVSGNADAVDSDSIYSNGAAAVTGQKTWFRVEPIKWYLMDTSVPPNEAKVISDLILASNCQLTWISTFLKYLTAANPDQVTEAHVPTYEDMTSGVFAKYTDDSVRMSKGSDFAIANRLMVYKNKHSEYYLNSTYEEFDLPYIIEASGDFQVAFSYDVDYIGIRPCITLKYDTCSIITFDNFVSSSSGIYKASDETYHITDFTGLKAMSDFTNANGLFNSTDKIFLDNNIDCTGQVLHTIKTFTGTFDGQGYILYNLELEGESAGTYFIDEITDATIHDIMFFDFNISDRTYASLFGRSVGVVTLSNIYRSGSTKAEVASGLISEVAPNSTLTVRACAIDCTKHPEGIDFYITQAAFVAINSGTLDIFDSYFIGDFIRVGETITGTCIGSGAARKISGVYIKTSGSSTYYTGFTGSEWICGDAINGGLPILQWFLWASSNVTTTSVETYLTNKNFKATSSAI